MRCLSVHIYGACQYTYIVPAGIHNAMPADLKDREAE